jgi:hypothetical protein
LSLFRYIRKRKYLERVSLTPEGFAYLTVLIFITLGSIVRNVNLLILMAGIMFAPLILNWRMAVYRIRALRGKRQLPRRIHVNQIANVKWIAENSQRSMPAVNVIVRDQLRRAPDDRQTLDRINEAKPTSRRGLLYRWFGELYDRIAKRKSTEDTAIARFPRLVAGQSEVQAYQVFFAQRGKYWVGPAEIVCSYPFGLIVSRQRIGQENSFFVAPAVGVLVPTWEQRVNSMAKGAESVRRTRAIEEDEFFALRPWRSGDSRKNIHWRSSAKHGSPIVKQFVERNNRDFAIVLDLHQDDLLPESRGDCETVLSFAATALLNIGADVEGQVSVAVCGTQCETFSSRTVAGVIPEVMPSLSVASGCPMPDLVTGIVSCLESVSDTTPIYVVSSRQQPASLKSGLIVEAIDHSQTKQFSTSDVEGSRAAKRHARYISRRIRQALPMVRWLDVRTGEFAKIFSSEAIGQAQSSSQASLSQVSKKWLKHAKS